VAIGIRLGTEYLPNLCGGKITKVLYRGPFDRWASGIGCAEVSHVAVRQTPDTRLNDPIVLAFNQWVFRPAQLNNQPVAVKVLLGIPL